MFLVCLLFVCCVFVNCSFPVVVFLSLPQRHTAGAKDDDYYRYGYEGATVLGEENL